MDKYFPYGSSRPEVFYKKGVLRIFTKFTGKHLFQCLFLNKSCRPQSYTVLAQMCFSVDFTKFFLRNFTNTFSYRAPLVAAPVLN